MSLLLWIANWCFIAVMECIGLVCLNVSQARYKGISWVKDPNEDHCSWGHTSTIFSFLVRAAKFCSGGRKWPAGRKFETPVLDRLLCSEHDSFIPSIIALIIVAIIRPIWELSKYTCCCNSRTHSLLNFLYSDYAIQYLQSSEYSLIQSKTANWNCV